MFTVAAEAYDRFMGRYSTLLAPQLVDFAGVAAGQRAQRGHRASAERKVAAAPDLELARPASEYVARFVGADRMLKRLALMTVGELETAPLDGVTAAAPRFSRETSVRDALAALLASPDESGVVVGEQDVPIGLLTLESVAATLRADPGAQASQAANDDEGSGAASEAARPSQP